MGVVSAPSTASGGKRTAGDAASDRHQEVLVALRRIIRATDLHSKRVAKDSGLTVPQVVLLQSVRGLGEVTTRELARRVSLSQATVTAILDRLDARGLIERYRSTCDRRIVHARLTRRGQSALRRAPALLRDRFISEFSTLSVTDQKRIVETLGQVAEMMGAEDLDASPLLDVGTPLATAPTPTPATPGRVSERSRPAHPARR